MMAASTWVLGVSLSMVAASGVARAEIRTEDGEGAGTSESAGALADPLAIARFETGSTRLDPADRRALEAAAAWLREHPQRLLIIEGHADPTGGATANLRLSQQRADVVREDLIRLGADPLRMVSAAYGEAEPTGARSSSRRVVVRGTVQPFPDLVREQRAPDVEEGPPAPREEGSPAPRDEGTPAPLE